MAGKYNTFEELILDHVAVTGPAQNGWTPCYCEVCGDGSRTKGPRGGWFFQDEVVLYNCFNQGCEGSYVLERDHPLSNSMADVMTAFGVPMREYKLLQLKLKQNAGTPGTKEAPKVAPIATMPIPSHFYKLADADKDDLFAIKAKRLLRERKIDPASYPFYLSTGKASKAEGPIEQSYAKALFNRLIIPAFRGEHMIYYQGRDLDGTAKLKYYSPPTPRSNLFYGMDKMYEHVKSPLFICEGFFDAHLVDGIATMENKITTAQATLLNKSPRKKVCIPDRKGDSKRLAQDCLDLGWGVAIPDWGSDVKDVNEAVIKYGKLYVAQSVIDSIKFGASARFVVGMMK